MITLRLGSKGDLVLTFQEGLAFLGYDVKPDGDFGPNTEIAVEAFQKAEGLYADGVTGKLTLQAFNDQMIMPEAAKYRIPFLMDRSAPEETGDDKLKWVKVPADKFMNRGGYTSLRLRSDAAKAYNDLYDETHRMGGIITTAGGKRSLASKSSPNRSRMSFHYTGRAFDMALPTAMQNPDEDPFIIVRKGNTRMWTVWCRSSLPVEEVDILCQRHGIQGGEVPLAATYAKGKKVLSKVVTAVAFDFTALAAKYGFQPISARRSFFAGGNYGGAEWWHFSWRTGMTEGETTFGEELLKAYTMAECEKFVYWSQVRNAVYGKDFTG